MRVREEPIKRYAIHQCDWSQLLPALVLRKGRCIVESPESRSIHGDAPKSFFRVKEYNRGQTCSKISQWPAYIAKVGSKCYPVESFTEHFLTRLGQLLGVRIADSKLVVIAGQVRFLSRYFLRQPRESLVHGLEIFRRHLDDEIVEEIACSKRESEFYTFQTVRDAIRDIYPEHFEKIMPGLVEMLAFDAVAGNNDRHPLNWGVIVPVIQTKSIRFAPIFDTARGLFWNLEDHQLGNFTSDLTRLDSYIQRSFPQIGWDGENRVRHFGLIRLIWREFPQYRKNLEKVAKADVSEGCAKILDGEFRQLMSDVRRHVIRTCVSRRHELYRECLS
jgi:hypothetical protein